MKGCFVGITGMDFVFYQEGFPPENSKSKTNKYTNFVGGPAANAAITYSLLGGKAILVTAIGDSPMGIIIKNELKNKFGVEVIDVMEGTFSDPFISAVSVNVLNGSRTIWSGQKSKYKPDDFQLNPDLSVVEFCLSDCNLFEISEPVLKIAKKSGIPVVLDAGSWKEQMPFYLNVSNYAIASSQCKTPGYKDFFETGSHYGIMNIAVTDGKNEIKWKSDRISGEILPPSALAIDTLAAGDIFHGAFCFYKFNNNLSFEKSLELASIVAAESVKYEGPVAWSETISQNGIFIL